MGQHKCGGAVLCLAVDIAEQLCVEQQVLRRVPWILHSFGAAQVPGAVLGFPVLSTAHRYVDFVWSAMW